MHRPFKLLAVLFFLYCPSVHAQTNSQHAVDHIDRGVEYGQQGDFQSAIQEFDQAIQWWPYKELGSWAYFYRGLAYEELGDLPQALSDYELALYADRNNEEARQKLKELIEKVGQLPPTDDPAGKLKRMIEEGARNCSIITGSMC